ncbi:MULTISPECIES: FHA domain-containing protein [unclassified Streptomyces]|uniref:FHA domain-containing protein n=1 Tax=unclassified Streptomyces TaxID=2593676 RepID=UPI0003A9724C|nr:MULTISPECIES: FHA domain-containing protein [unclassified Streptomyces]MYX32069.1 FHA domain-containing protein [Streptomyces sp. SID8377]
MPGHSAAPPQLIVTTGPDAGRAYAVPAGYCEIGRLAGSGIRLDAEGVSRRHAAMNRAGSHVVLSDLGSTNGTYLNGTLLDAPRPLRDGDLLRIGHVELRLSVEAARHGPARPGDPEDGAAEERGEDPGGASPPPAVLHDLGDTRTPSGPGGTHRYASGRAQYLAGRRRYGGGGDGREADPGAADEACTGLFRVRGAGRVLMAAGVLVALAGFAVWVSLILSLLGGAGSAQAPPDPFAESLWGLPKAPLGFTAFAAGAVLCAGGAALSRHTRAKGAASGRRGPGRHRH